MMLMSRPLCDLGCWRGEVHSDENAPGVPARDQVANDVFDRTSSQAPSYASPKLRPTDSLTGVKCRATSIAKKTLDKFVGTHRALGFV